jgi:uncharacterized membrane protein YkoI
MIWTMQTSRCCFLGALCALARVFSQLGSLAREAPLLLGGAAVLTLALAGSAPADDFEEAYRLRERRDILPLEELLRRADLAPDTRILEIETELEQGRWVYEIEYVDGAGRIRELMIDARTGAVLADEED